MRHRRSLLFLGVVTFVFLARPLIGAGSLLPVDIVEGAAPWRADAPSLTGPDNPLLSDTLDVHTHFASIADDARSGSLSWWDRSVGGGIPTLKAGFSPLLWLYLLVPAWYAPGLVAAARTLLAALLTYGFLRELRTGRAAATVGGVAYCLSGFMVGWAGWPQSNVAAFLPGLFWAIERVIRRPAPARAVPVALVVAAMVVSNFPLVTAYGLLAAAGYTVWRVVDTDRRDRVGRGVRSLAVAGWGVVLGVGLSSFHLLAFGEYFAWADTSARERIPADTSIGGQYLWSILFPRPFGSEHAGEAFWGDGQNWVETQSYAGLAVVILALLSLATCTRRRGARGAGATRATAVRSLWAVALAGAWISYVGGPPTELVQSLPLLGQNSVGRARVIVNLALAVLAGLGVQAWLDARRGDRDIDIRRGLRTAAVGVGVVGVATAPFTWSWLDGARDRGLVGETLVGLWAPLVAGAAMVGLLWWFRPGASPSTGGRVFAGGTALVVAAELLWFAHPVATVVDRDRADLATPAHVVASSLLDPGERMGADARTFFANTGQITGLDDMRGHLLTPAGWRSVYAAIDPDHFRPPGSVTNPWFTDVDLTSPALDSLAVGVWAADPAVPIVGTRSAAPAGPDIVEIPATGDGGGVSGSTVVPDGGLRAVTVAVEGMAVGELHAVLQVDGHRHESSVLLEVTPPRAGLVDVGFVGVEAPPGSAVEVRFTRSDPSPLTLRADGTQVALGTVSAGDGVRLVHTGDVVLYERPSAAAARLVFAVEEREGTVETSVHETATAGRIGVVAPGSATGLPAVTPAGVTGSTRVERAEGGTVDVEVVTSDRALVVVSQPFYPGWTATVDGRSVPVVEVDGAFAGVVVPAGEHRVSLRYEPTYLPQAGALTALAICGLLASVWLDPRRRDRR